MIYLHPVELSTQGYSIPMQKDGMLPSLFWHIPTMIKMCWHWVTAKICFSVQMFKYPNIWMSQTAAKSLPNIETVILFVQIWKKVDISGKAVFCPNFISTSMSANYPNFKI
jgi:hypothetical protein